MLKFRFLFAFFCVLANFELASQSMAVSIGTGVEYLRVKNHIPLYNLYSDMHPRLSACYQLYLLKDKLLLGAGYNYGGYQYNILDLEMGKRIHQKFNMHAAIIKTMYVTPVFTYLFKKRIKRNKSKKELNLYSGLTHSFIFTSSWNPYGQQLKGREFITLYQLYLSAGLSLKFYAKHNKVSSASLVYDWGINDIDRVFYGKSRLNGFQISFTKYFNARREN